MEFEDQEERQEDRRAKHWHFDRTISIGHLITTLTIGGSVLIWAMHMETRVVVLENMAAYGKETNAKIERDVRDRLGDVNAMLIRIESKLDTKADK